MRIGHGYDVHKLVEGRPLILGGVSVPHTMGLLGHSDADVLTHAVMDALLGAAALGDIGRHFPDTDNSYKNIDSQVLLMRVMELLKQRGYRVVNVDATIIAQRPKLMNYLPEMVKTLAKNMNVSEDRINIKATTEEGLGFTGAQEGISAHCVCLIEQVSGIKD